MPFLFLIGFFRINPLPKVSLRKSVKSVGDILNLQRIINVMKENKIVILSTLLATFLLYFVTYTSVGDNSSFEALSIEDKTFFFNDLDDKQSEGIATTEMDSLKIEFFENDTIFHRIKSMPIDTYKTFQKISQESLEIEQTLHTYRRLILILFLFLSSYFLFTKKFKNNITFQKAMYHNAINSLIFAVFCIFSFVLTQTIRGTGTDSSILVQFGFAHFIEVLKSSMIWFILISFFIYFNPQNIDWYQRRMEKKKAKQEKANK